MGQAISRPMTQTFLTPGGDFWVEIGYTKLRGRGKNAPEKKYGSDGIFQIKVLDKTGKIIRAKGLPFQSKKNWRTKQIKLAHQARNMELSTPGGIVIDFSTKGYTACDAADVVRFEGDKRALESSGKVRRLGQLLGDDFLNCHIGKLNLFFDPEKEQYKIAGDNFHIITTTIKVAG